MNVKGNQRFLETDEAIQQAFKELLAAAPDEGITVSGICRSTGINRASFYLHYADINALMASVMLEMSKNMVAEVTRNGTRNVGDGFVNLFRFVGENADFYRACLAQERMLPFIMPPELHVTNDNLRNLMGYTSSAEFEYHEHFFMAGISEMMRIWLNRGCPETPEEMAEIIAHEYSPKRSPFIWSD